MREMNMQKEAEKLPQIQERKKNPLGRPNNKPNKGFLDRTINSVMTHNKREHDRNYRNCQRKLRDLDNAKDEKSHRKRRYSQSSTHSISSNTSEEKKKRSKKSKKIKKKKKKHKKAVTSSSSSSSSDSSLSSSSSNTISSKEGHDKKKKRNKRKGRDDSKEEFNGEYYDGGPYDPSLGGMYMDPNMALAAAMAYSHMNQQLLQTNCQVQEDILKKEMDSDDDKVDIPSDLSLTYHSSESEELNISLNSSSAEEDENGILTFDLNSDEESNKRNRKNRKPFAKISRKTKRTHSSPETTSDSDDNDVESVHSHISLKSDDSRKGNTSIDIVHVSILSSSSDTDCEVVIELINDEAIEENRNEKCESDVPDTNDVELLEINSQTIISNNENETDKTGGEKDEHKITISNVDEDDIGTGTGVKGDSISEEKDEHESDKINCEISVVETPNIKSDISVNGDDNESDVAKRKKSTDSNNTFNANTSFELKRKGNIACTSAEYVEDGIVKSDKVDPIEIKEPNIALHCDENESCEVETDKSENGDSDNAKSDLSLMKVDNEKVMTYANNSIDSTKFVDINTSSKEERSASTSDEIEQLNEKDIIKTDEIALNFDEKDEYKEHASSEVIIDAKETLKDQNIDIRIGVDSSTKDNDGISLKEPDNEPIKENEDILVKTSKTNTSEVKNKIKEPDNEPMKENEDILVKTNSSEVKIEMKTVEVENEEKSKQDCVSKPSAITTNEPANDDFIDLTDD